MSDDGLEGGDPGDGGEGAALAQLSSRIYELQEQSRYRSQARLLPEALETARRAKKLELVIELLFTQANNCNHTLTPRIQRQASAELVTVLESEDAARRLQPDLSDELYEQQRLWFTSCAYDNLAIATACLEGYNSPGMYGAVGEGVEKCRQTGKAECITCFREYGVGVSLSADDLDLAEKQALQLTRRAADVAQHDRRAVSWKELGQIALLRGQPRQGLEAFSRGFELVTAYHDPEDLKRTLLRKLEEAYLLLGMPGEWQGWVAKHSAQLPEPTPPGEDASTDNVIARCQSVRALLEGDHAEAQEMLETWCRTHEETGHLAAWFEDRARLAAALLLGGQRERASAVAEATAGKAGAARDWLTLRRLQVLFDDSGVSPVAGVEPLDEGPFKPRTVSRPLPSAAPQPEPAPESEPGPATAPASEPEPAAAAEPAAADHVQPAGPPQPPPAELVQALEAWQDRLQEAEDADPILDEITRELLAIRPTTVDDPRDARAWLLAASWCAGSGREALAMWKSGRLLGKRFADDATVHWLLADLGLIVSERAGTEPDAPGTDAIVPLFQKSLELDPENPLAHHSAGRFYLEKGDLGEAERCLARACRLDRTHAQAALKLAEVYRGTDRPGDAVDVLDLAIRHGCRDPMVAWEAGLGAFSEGRHEPCVSYLDLYLELPEVDRAWANYYRAASLVELSRADDALEAVAAELKINEGARFAGTCLRAAAHALNEDQDAARGELRRALESPLSQVDQLNAQGLTRNLERLRQTALEIGDAELAERVARRALRAGLVSDAWLRERRKQPDNPVMEDLVVYRVSYDQKFPDGWGEDPDCPRWEQEWKGYHVAFYVLAAESEGARRLAAAVQAEAVADPARESDVDMIDEGPYRDQPGIVGISVREPLSSGDSDSDSESEDEA